MGFILGFLKRFNIFKLKKDCTASIECGACYSACPIRIKSIYTERKTEQVQIVDCLMCGECIDKCPENSALLIILCDKKIYTLSRKRFMSKYEREKNEQVQREKCRTL